MLVHADPGLDPGSGECVTVHAYLDGTSMCRDRQNKAKKMKNSWRSKSKKEKSGGSSPVPLGALKFTLAWTGRNNEFAYQFYSRARESSTKEFSAINHGAARTTSCRFGISGGNENEK